MLNTLIKLLTKLKINLLYIKKILFFMIKRLAIIPARSGSKELKIKI